MILGMGVPELAVILVVVLVVFGPKNLPKLGSSLGKTVKNLREGVSGGKDKGPGSRGRHRRFRRRGRLSPTPVARPGDSGRAPNNASLLP